MPRNWLKVALAPLLTLVALGTGGVLASVSASAAPVSSTYTASASAGNSWLFGASCPKTQTTHCYLAGDTRGLDPQGTAGSGVIYHDWVNGGAGPWTQDTGVPASPDGLSAISCPDTNNCWVVGGNGRILHNSRAATSMNWSIQVAPISNNLYGVSCYNNSHCVAVGDTGTILYTADRGATWTAIVPPVAGTLLGVSCATPTRCVAVGTGGEIIRSTNGGSAWTAETSGTARTLNGVYCNSFCYAVGDNGAGGTPPSVILYSTGPNVWKPATTNPSNASLSSVACSTTTKCSAAAVSGQVIGTTNGGSVWFDDSPGTVNELLAVTCMEPSQRCVVTGENGTVYHQP